MTPSTTPHQPPAYTPESDADTLRWWHRVLKPGEIMSSLALIAALLSVLGFHYSPPSALEARVAAVEKRVDSLANSLQFISYMQCVQLRKTDPASLPPNCAPVIERGVR